MGLWGRWRGFCRRSGVSGDRRAAFADLDRRYRAPGRHYHTWAHVTSCLRLFRRVRSLAREPAALELALWFHDAVYAPGAADNEERSAELAGHWSSALGLAPDVIDSARRLILATRHAPADSAGAGDEALVRDIDLAVLGGRAGRYRVYEHGIRREYSRMPPERFRAGRIELLRGFLARPAIYATCFFRERYERRARRNLARACARLARSAGRDGAGGAAAPRPGPR
jgi:predicted metal-dependent HD superfamily phosphohydrolase